MRARGVRIQEILLGLALLAGLAWNIARASEINGLELHTGPTGTRAELVLSGEGAYKVISLANPDRLVVDLPGSRPGNGFRLPAGAGLVRAVRQGSPEPDVTRIVFDLAAPVVALGPRVERGASGARLVIEWPGDDGGDPLAGIIEQVSNTPQASALGAVTPADQAAASRAATDRLITGTTRPPATATEPVGTPTPAAGGTGQTASAPPVAVTPAPAPGAQQPVTPPSAAANVPLRPLVIAIDAGHGGQDPGAVGPTGKREKDITLAIARELARQVDATPGLRAFLTRDRDVFIPLAGRTRLAREAGADMFISIHADAAENQSAQGSSVYVLSLRGASSQRARWLADKENAADLIGGTRLPQADDTLTSVLLDLTQSGQMKASEDAGRHILDGLKRIGNNHKPHIERANFAVLRTSDMPAMLVETAFLSNPEEERRLIDPNFQRTVARAVLDGVNTYFSSQPPPGTLYAVRAAQGSGASAPAGGSR